jgi:hypothetical protein
MSFEQAFCELLRVSQEMDINSRMVEMNTSEGILLLLDIKSFGPWISVYFKSNPDEYVGFISETIKPYREQINQFQLSMYHSKSKLWKPTSPLPLGFWWNNDPLSRGIYYGFSTFFIRHMNRPSHSIWVECEEMSDLPLSTFVEKMEKKLGLGSLNTGYYTEQDLHFVETDDKPLSSLLCNNKKLFIASFA